MKRCLTCSRVYDDDDLRFCFDDGTPLIDKPAAPGDVPTIALPPTANNVPTMKEEFRPEVPPVSPTAWEPGISAPPQKRSLRCLASLRFIRAADGKASLTAPRSGKPLAVEPAPESRPCPKSVLRCIEELPNGVSTGSGSDRMVLKQFTKSSSGMGYGPNWWRPGRYRSRY